MSRRNRSPERRGISSFEWAVLAVLVGAAAIGGIAWVGSGTSVELEKTSGMAGKPAPYKSPFTKGNNGLGNGIDGAPPGAPKENDGEGTSPGNPGNK